MGGAASPRPRPRVAGADLGVHREMPERLAWPAELDQRVAETVVGAHLAAGQTGAPVLLGRLAVAAHARLHREIELDRVRRGAGERALGGEHDLPDRRAAQRERGNVEARGRPHRRIGILAGQVPRERGGHAEADQRPAGGAVKQPGPRAGLPLDVRRATRTRSSAPRRTARRRPRRERARSGSRASRRRRSATPDGRCRPEARRAARLRRPSGPRPRGPRDGGSGERRRRRPGGWAGRRRLGLVGTRHESSSVKGTSRRWSIGRWRAQARPRSGSGGGRAAVGPTSGLRAPSGARHPRAARSPAAGRALHQHIPRERPAVAQENRRFPAKIATALASGSTACAPLPRGRLSIPAGSFAHHRRSRPWAP